MNSLQSLMVRFSYGLVRAFSSETRLPILIYHQVLSGPDEYRPMEPTIEKFARQMDVVRDNFRVVRLDEALTRLREGTLEKDSIAITFDDGYRDNLYNAANVLSEKALCATFFVATGYLNGGRMWNDTIIDAIKYTEYPVLDLTDEGLGTFDLADRKSRPSIARKIIRSIKYFDGDNRLSLAGSIENQLKVHLSSDYMLTDDEVCQLDAMGMEIGAHTVTHPILRNSKRTKAESELIDSKEYLENLLNKDVKSFAYPNGRYGIDYDESITRIVDASGYTCAVTTEGGVNKAGDDMFQLKRFTPWDKSVFKYALRLLSNTYIKN